MLTDTATSARSAAPRSARKGRSKQSYRNKKKQQQKKQQKKQMQLREEKEKQQHSAAEEATTIHRSGTTTSSSSSSSKNNSANHSNEVEIEYTVADDLQLVDESVAQQFAEVFARFGKLAGDEDATGDEQDSNAQMTAADEDTAAATAAAAASAAPGEGNKKKPTRKQRKELQRLKVAVLKQAVHAPEVVTIEDVTAADPALLVHLKATENTVPVPRHWSQKRKYLQNKQGSEQSPFTLPKFIADTGIGGMREAYREKEDAKTAKATQRDRMAPKMGKMEINCRSLGVLLVLCGCVSRLFRLRSDVRVCELSVCVCFFFRMLLCVCTRVRALCCVVFLTLSLASPCHVHFGAPHFPCV
jgi:splicing factor 3B subunit 2